MALKTIVEDAEAIRRTRADILMSSGSYAAVDALAYVAMQHASRALRDADQDLSTHWQDVWTILDEAKRKLGDLK